MRPRISFAGPFSVRILKKRQERARKQLMGASCATVDAQPGLAESWPLFGSKKEKKTNRGNGMTGANYETIIARLKPASKHAIENARWKFLLRSQFAAPKCAMLGKSVEPTTRLGDSVFTRFLKARPKSSMLQVSGMSVAVRWISPSPHRAYSDYGHVLELWTTLGRYLGTFPSYSVRSSDRALAQKYNRAVHESRMLQRCLPTARGFRAFRPMRRVDHDAFKQLRNVGNVPIHSRRAVGSRRKSHGGYGRKHRRTPGTLAPPSSGKGYRHTNTLHDRDPRLDQAGELEAWSRAYAQSSTWKV